MKNLLNKETAIYILFSVIVGLCIWFSLKKSNTNIVTDKINNSDSSIKFTSHSLKEKSKDTYSLEQIEFLKKMNMVHSQTYSENSILIDKKLSDFYFKKFHLDFISNEFMEKFLKEKDLVIGNLADFNANIPAKNIDEFQFNFEAVLKIDSTLRDKYFIRVSMQSKDNSPGKFLQFIDKNEIIPEMLKEVEGGAGIEPHGQLGQWNASFIVLNKKFYYAKKYKIKDKNDIIVDHSTGAELKVIAPKEYFNLTGKEIVNNQVQDIKLKDPAIILRVNSGWLKLTSWK